MQSMAIVRRSALLLPLLMLATAVATDAAQDHYRVLGVSRGADEAQVKVRPSLLVLDNPMGYDEFVGATCPTTDYEQLSPLLIYINTAVAPCRPHTARSQRNFIRTRQGNATRYQALSFVMLY